jgi:hypothetical protein
MSFDPEKVQRYDFCPGSKYDCDPGCTAEMSQAEGGEYVRFEDYAQLKTLLHDVSTEADPAGTLRELRQAQDTIKALEARIAELEELTVQKESARDIAFEDAAIHIELLQLEPRENIAAHYAKCIRALKTNGEGQ